MIPSLVLADESGKIREDPCLLMLCNRAGEWQLPEPADLIPLPAESELFLLPGRRAAGYNPATGKIAVLNGLAVAAFAAPGYTLSAHPCYVEDGDAPMLPLFAYGAVGYARGRFWISALKVDDDPRQRFAGIKRGRLEKESRQLLLKYPENRLVGHIINNCVRRYDCPAARNFALGRYEAPLPTSRACNARCLGCISYQDSTSPIPATPQCRLNFTPDPEEVAEVMRIHEQRERARPIYSFGQGCEGDPLVNAGLLCESARIFRALDKKGLGHGTLNCNTNASRPEVIPALAEAGFTSIRASLNSARPELYSAYYRPQGYNFADVRESLRQGRLKGLFVSLNLLYFPGITDTWAELRAMEDLVAKCGVSMIQLRNLNIDPEWYPRQMEPALDQTTARPLGLRRFMKELSRKCPWLRFGYFNPWLGDKADLQSPQPE